MKIPIVFFLVFAGIFFYSCEKSTDAPPKTMTQDSIEILTDTMEIKEFWCRHPLIDNNKYEDEYIIRSEDEYYSKLQVYCPDSTLPDIDFDNYMLLAKKLHTIEVLEYRDIGYSFKKTILKDNINKKLNYIIYQKIFYGIGYKGDTLAEPGSPHVHMNWIKVPQVPNDYSVEIDTIQVHIYKR